MILVFRNAQMGIAYVQLVLGMPTVASGCLRDIQCGVENGQELSSKIKCCVSRAGYYLAMRHPPMFVARLINQLGVFSKLDCRMLQI